MSKTMPAEGAVIHMATFPRWVRCGRHGMALKRRVDLETPQEGEMG